MMADVKWIKITTDIFDDEKILLIESMPDADAIIVIWFKLLCLAGKMNNSGVFLMNGRIAYTDEMLATIFRRKPSTVKMALATFERFGMIEIVDGTITIPNWGKHQSLDKIEAQNKYQREYMAQYRKRQKLLASGNALDDCKPNCKPNSNPNDEPNSNPNVRPLDKNREELEENKIRDTHKDANRPIKTDDMVQLMKEKGISEALQDKILDWVIYKWQTHKDHYYQKGFNSLASQVAKKEQKHGSAAVIEQIDVSMGEGWKGMHLEKLDEKAKPPGGYRSEPTGFDALMKICEEESYGKG